MDDALYLQSHTLSADLHDDLWQLPTDVVVHIISYIEMDYLLLLDGVKQIYGKRHDQSTPRIMFPTIICESIMLLNSGVHLPDQYPCLYNIIHTCFVPPDPYQKYCRRIASWTKSQYRIIVEEQQYTMMHQQQQQQQYVVQRLPIYRQCVGVNMMNPPSNGEYMLEHEDMLGTKKNVCLEGLRSVCLWETANTPFCQTDRKQRRFPALHTLKIHWKTPRSDWPWHGQNGLLGNSKDWIERWICVSEYLWSVCPLLRHLYLVIEDAKMEGIMDTLIQKRWRLPNHVHLYIGTRRTPSITTWMHWAQVLPTSSITFYNENEANDSIPHALVPLCGSRIRISPYHISRGATHGTGYRMSLQWQYEMVSPLWTKQVNHSCIINRNTTQVLNDASSTTVCNNTHNTIMPATCDHFVTIYNATPTSGPYQHHHYPGDAVHVAQWDSSSACFELTRQIHGMHVRIERSAWLQSIDDHVHIVLQIMARNVDKVQTRVHYDDIHPFHMSFLYRVQQEQQYQEHVGYATDACNEVHSDLPRLHKNVAPTITTHFYSAEDETIAVHTIRTPFDAQLGASMYVPFTMEGPWSECVVSVKLLYKEYFVLCERCSDIVHHHDPNVNH